MSIENRAEIENYSISIIKPDAFRDHLDQMIIADFEDAGLEVIHRKEFKLDQPTAEYVYDEHRTDTERYPFMVQSLLLKDKQGEQLPCMLLVLRGKPDGEMSALDHTRKTKGRADKDGIRAKYAMYRVGELKKMGYEGDELRTLLSRNRLHVPDDYCRTLEVLGVLLTERDLDAIQEVDPQFAGLMRECFSDINRSLIVTPNGKDSKIE